MKFIKKFNLWLLLLVLMAWWSTDAVAQEIRLGYGNTDHVSLHAQVNKAEGTVDVGFILATSYGASWDGHSGFCESDGTITIGDVTFSIRQTDKGDCYNKVSSVTVSGDVKKDDLSFAELKEGTDVRYGLPGESGSESKLAVYYRYKLKQSELGRNLYIRISGTFWRRDPSSDEDVNQAGWLSIPSDAVMRDGLGVDDPIISKPSIHIDGKPQIAFDVTHLFAPQDNQKGHYLLYTRDGQLKKDVMLSSAVEYKSFRDIPSANYLVGVNPVKAETWRYTTQLSGSNEQNSWTNTNFNDASWSQGEAGFGTSVPNMKYPKTRWATSDIWMRKEFTANMSKDDVKNLVFVIYHDEDAEIYLNGKEVMTFKGYITNYTMVSFPPQAVEAFNPKGRNVLAVHVHQTTGGQYIDVGIAKALRSLRFDLGTEAGELNPDSLDQLQIVRSYVPYGKPEALVYQTPAVNVPIGAYPLPQDFRALYDDSKHEIMAEWSIERAPNKIKVDESNHSLDDVMRVTFEKGGKVVKTYDVPYRANVTTYTQTYTVPVAEVADYVVKVCRLFKNADGTKELRYKENTVNLGVNSNHYYASKPEIVTTPSGAQIKVRWDINGGVWSTNTKCYLVRQDVNSGSNTEIELSKTKFLAGTYTDADVINLHTYRYNIVVEPGGDYERRLSESSNTAIPYRPGTKISIQASQGEFADKVNVKWAARDFSVYSIERRRMDDDTDEFAEVARVDNATSSSSNNNFVDELTLPGVIYQYRVICKNIGQQGEVLQTDTLTDYGFRKTSGDINGRVVFEDGSAVNGADVRITAYDEVKQYSLRFDRKLDAPAVLNSDSIMTGAEEFTLQAMVCPYSAGTVIYKKGVFGLGVTTDSTMFMVRGKVSINDTLKLDQRKWSQLTAVSKGDSVHLYVNGQLRYECHLDSVDLSGSYRKPSTAREPIVLGANYQGNLSEVRIWSRALTPDEIANNYNRYLVGNEPGLEVYYNFSFPCEGRFFDSSYRGTVFNRRHGAYDPSSVALDDQNHPSAEQLAYAGKTDENGVYAIRNVLYYGNGTSYMVKPLLSNHRFNPTSEVRFFSSTSSSHSINFTDKSSFAVPVRIVYSGGEYPVEGVRFEIDGKAVMKENKVVTTDANGEVTLNVPIGVHKVQAVKEGHTFGQDGYLVDHEGNPLNYQNDMNVRTLADSTRVLFIGRIVGGTTEGNKTIGFGQSKNNLSANSTLTITPIKEHAVNTSGQDLTYTYKHRALTIDTLKWQKQLESNPRAQLQNRNNNSNTVTWRKDNIVAHVAEKTGEFHAWLLPEKYTVKVNIPGQEQTYVNNISGNNATLDLTSTILTNTTVIIKDSVYHATDSTYSVFMSTERMPCHSYKDYTLRTKPLLTAVQLTDGGEEMAYYGDSIMANSLLVGKIDTLRVWNNSSKPGYYFDHPILNVNKEYTWRLRISEDYVHNETGVVDHVACSNAKFTVNNKTAGKPVDIKGDSITGSAIYTFKPTSIDMTTARSSIAIHASFGQHSGDQTSVAWHAPFADANGGQEMLTIGGVRTGSNFVTAGPKNVLFVLRDPPGSQSYSTMSLNTSWSESSAYKGGVKFTQNFSGDVALGTANRFLVVTNIMECEAYTYSADEIPISESYSGTNSKKRSWGTGLSFKTSNSPKYVGSDGDLYVGYSTNIVFGRSEQIMLVKGEDYRKDKDLYIKAFTPENADWVLASRSLVSMGDSVTTMFDYAQADIIKTVIPDLISLRNKLFTPLIDGNYEKTEELLYEKVYQPGNESKIYYISKVPVDSPNFATPDNYACIHNVIYWSKRQKLDNIMFKDGSDGYTYVMPDSVAIFNQWIENWKTQIARNEEAKAKATVKVQNYTYASGSSAIEYKETYATSRSISNGFSVSIGYSHTFGAKQKAITGGKFEAQQKQKIGGETNHGGDWSSDVQRSHTYGFVLQDGDGDHLSVDVFREPKWDKEKEEYEYHDIIDADTAGIKSKSDYNTFIFKKIGGATSLPYEDAEEVKYWSGHIGEKIDAATMQIDKPVLRIPNAMIEGVPMGDVAYVDIEMGNASDSYDARPYMLKVDDETVPDGLEITIDGIPVKNWPVYKIDYGQTLKKTIAIRSGKAMNYDNIRLMLTANHGTPAIADKVKSDARFSVHFVPSSSPVALTQPSGDWNYNTALPDTTYNGHKAHYMPITISGYDVNYPNFSHIALQLKRKGQGDDKWVEQHSWTKQQLVAMDGVINYSLVLDDYADDSYEMRAVSFANVNNIMYERSSDIRSGIKDMVCPRAYGEPSPNDGILTPGDKIEIVFNEPIAQGHVNKEFISVRGVLNGEVDTEYSTFVSLNGQNGMLSTELEHTLGHNPFTLEMQARVKSFPAQGEAPIFVHGGAYDYLGLGLDAEHRLVVHVADQTYTASKPCPDNELQVGTWANIAMSYDPEVKKVIAYCNGKQYVVATDVPEYQGTAPVQIGHGIDGRDAWWHADIATLRMWQRVLDGNQIMDNAVRHLSGREQSLVACYNINEGRGTVLEDCSHGINLIMNSGAQWTLPEGRALEFNGQQQYAKIDASKSIVTPDADWTLQLWFRSQPNQTGATIISTGESAPDAGSVDFNRFSIRFDNGGTLTYQSGKEKVDIGAGYNDGAWHCLAVTLSRTTGFIRFYMDGVMKAYHDADDFGGIETNEFTLGAKQTLVTGDWPTYSEYFAGSIDDIQLWNLARSQRQLQYDYNQELTGNETGLRGYWPFDQYKQFEQAIELDTTMVNLADPDRQTSGRRYGATFTAECAPVKDAQVDADIPFDFITSERGIMIIPTAKNSAIENRRLTISVRDIKDLHGNTMESPYTWTALVNQSNVGWVAQNENVTMLSADGHESELYLYNLSGRDYNYSITNVPVWMHIVEPVGIAKAGQMMALKYYIDKGMAVGNYTEVLYLNVETQTPASLYLTINVRGNQPDWKTANPHAQYKTNVFGQMSFDGHYSTDTDDMLAAFIGSKCIGVANTSYDYNLDMHYALLTINYDVIDTVNISKLEFRAYDASTGVIYQVQPSEPVVCQNNKVYGTPVNPVVFKGSEEVMIDYALKTGWNWISLPLDNANLATAITSFDCIEGNFSANDIFKSFDRACKFTNGGEWNRPERFALNNDEMYMVRVKKDVTMHLRGTSLVNQHKSLTLQPRWNWISYTPLTNLSLLQALANYPADEGDIIKSADEFAIFSKGFWVGSLKYMEPGGGYMFYNKSDQVKTLTYPSSSALRAYNNNQSIAHSASYAPSTMSIIAQIADMQPGDVLVAHTTAGNDVEATPVEVDGNTLQFLSLSADEGTPLRFSIQRDDELISAINSTTYAPNAVDGSIEHPVVVIASEGGNLKAYPTPATSVLYVEHEMQSDGTAQFSVLDAQGRIVKTLPSVTATMGHNTQQIDVSTLASGHYFVTKTSADGSETVRFIKK